MPAFEGTPGRLTSGERQAMREAPALLAAGVAWTDKVLNYSGPGWLLQEGIKQGIEKSSYGDKGPANMALSALTVAHAIRHQADVALRQFVKEARAAGASWADIAAQLGTSKQAVAQKYGK